MLLQFHLPQQEHNQRLLQRTLPTLSINLPFSKASVPHYCWGPSLYRNISTARRKENLDWLWSVPWKETSEQRYVHISFHSAFFTYPSVPSHSNPPFLLFSFLSAPSTSALPLSLHDTRCKTCMNSSILGSCLYFLCPTQPSLVSPFQQC